MPDQLQLLEARVLAGASTASEWERLELAGIGAEDFETLAPVYAYCAGNIESFGLMPRLRDLVDTFNLPTGLQRDSTQHASDVAEFAKVVLARRIQQAVSESVEEYSEDPNTMLGAIIQSLGNIAITGAGAHASISDSSAEARLKRYADDAADLKRRGASMAGIPTGISHFDQKFKLGWLPGELIGIVARTFVGKTWLLMACGVTAWMNGKRVLMLNPELSKDEAEARFDILLAAKHGITSVSLDALYRGVNPPDDFKELLRNVAARRSDWITYTNLNSKPFTVADVQRLTRQHQPDLVLVDGLMLLKSPLRRSAIWEQVIDLCGGLKNVAQAEGVPIIVCHQANRSAGNIYRPPRLSEIAGGDAFGWDCDRILALCQYQAQEDEPDSTGFLRVTIQKFRKGEPLFAGVRFRFEPGKGQVYEDAERRDIRTSGDAGAEGQAESSGHELARPVPLP